VEPQYPEAARKARMEGVVILEAIITADGNVEDVRVLKSVNPLLDASAVRAVGQWKYKPATLNGRAVRVYLTVTVTFRLN
jgi:protein TonB